MGYYKIEKFIYKDRTGVVVGGCCSRWGSRPSGRAPPLIIFIRKMTPLKKKKRKAFKAMLVMLVNYCK